MKKIPNRTRTTAVVAALALGLSTVVIANQPAGAAAPTDSLVAWYPLTTDLKDASGNGRDGTGQNGVAPEGDLGVRFSGTNYVKLPDNMLAGVDAMTVTAEVLVDPSLSGNHFIYNLGNVAVGNPASGTGYVFQTALANYTGKITPTWWNGEQVMSASAPLPRSRWVNIAMTIDGANSRMYLDGKQVASQAAVTTRPSEIGGGRTTANFLAKSAYAADGLFKGRMRDFRLYSRALTDAEVQEVNLANAPVSLATDVAALDLGDTSDVTTNLRLPDVAPNGARVTWRSANPALVSDAGVVTRPEEAPASTTLTATLTGRDGSTRTKDFTITVPARLSAAERAQLAVDSIVVPNLGDARGNLTLPTTAGPEAVAVAWASSDPARVTTTGEVHRPAQGEPEATATLTATATVDGATAWREFEAKLPALPGPLDMEGYLFSYFVGEGSATGEQVYFGLSRGNDPLHYQDLNRNEPVLTSSLGEKGLRDPFIIRSPEGDKFYQIATDLRIYHGAGWDAAQRTGSKSIMVWESTDLVNWTDQRLVKVSPDTAGNTWAPEAYYDDSLGAYVVFWASKLYDPTDVNHTANTYNRMMYATTRDFRTFTEAKVWIDPGYSVIDSTVIKHDATYYRFTKDERSNTSGSACGKFITGEKSNDLRSLAYTFVTDCIGKGEINQGEGPLVFKDNEAEKWYMFIDEFGGRGYVPFESTNLDAGAKAWTVPADYQMPSRPRHGTVLPVTRAEYDRLLATYQPDAVVTEVETVAQTVQVGQAPVLPAQVRLTHADGSTSNAAVTWDAVAPEQYAVPGTFSVLGTVKAAPGRRAVANITVQLEPIAVTSITLGQQNVMLKPGNTARIAASVEPANATDRTLQWRTSDPAVAMVDKDGNITALKAGAAVVTARANGSNVTVEASVAVTVVDDVTDGLVLHYEFEGADETEIEDISGNGNTGAVTSGASRVDGVHGSAVQLSNTDKNYVTLPAGLLATDAITVATWLKWSNTNQDPWTWALGTTDQKYFFQAPSHWSGGTTAGITTKSYSAEARATRPGDLPGETWVQATATLGGGVLKYYVDGQLGAEKATTLTPRDVIGAPDVSGYIGRSTYAGDPYFSGLVDDFRIYHRALDGAEVAVLAQEPKEVVVPSPSPDPSDSGTASPTPSETVSPSPLPTRTVTVTPSTSAPATVVVTPPVPTVTVRPPSPRAPYEVPGHHLINGRHWFTVCEPYSQTMRCRTDIWATQVTQVNGRFVQRTGWYFNNLTYLPYLTRAQWRGNPLATPGQFTAADGRKWRTECDTPATGRNACRSYIRSSYIASARRADGTWRYYWTEGWVFNNIVGFRQG